MIIWLKIRATPPTEFWSAEGARSLLTADLRYRRLQAVGVMRSQASLGGGTENASVTVTLGNGDGRLTSVFALPPLKQPADILSNSEGVATVLFTGLVSRVVLGSTITLTLEA